MRTLGYAASIITSLAFTLPSYGTENVCQKYINTDAQLTTLMEVNKNENTALVRKRDFPGFEESLEMRLELISQTETNNQQLSNCQAPKSFEEFDLKKDTAKTYFLLGLANKIQKNRELASQYFKKALELFPENKEYLSFVYQTNPKRKK